MPPSTRRRNRVAPRPTPNTEDASESPRLLRRAAAIPRPPRTSTHTPVRPEYHDHRPHRRLNVNDYPGRMRAG